MGKRQTLRPARNDARFSRVETETTDESTRVDCPNAPTGLLYFGRMIVARREAERIRSGRKVQLRLPLSRRPPAVDMVVPVSYQEPNPALGYVNGRPRLQPVLVCYIEILERWQTLPSAATEKDVEELGHPTEEDFRAAWPRPEDPVWALRFRLDPRHHPRLLSASVIAGRQGGYVEHPARALPDEPEAVDPFTQARYAREANERDLAREKARRQERAEMPFEFQLASLKREARERHIDIRSELRAIERWTSEKARAEQLEVIRRKLEAPLMVPVA